VRKPPKVKRAWRILWLIGACVFGAGCQTTREKAEPVRALSTPEQEELARVIAQTITHSESASRSAAALATSEQATGKLGDALNAIAQAIDVCENNLANVETTAFKSSRSAYGPDGKPFLQIDFEQGSLENTGRQLDLGIAGTGLLKVKISDHQGDGFGYTRNGNLFVNKDGDLLVGMGDGNRLCPMIWVPKGVTDIQIAADGRVEATVPGITPKKVLGQVQLARFVNEQGLSHLGGSLFCRSEASGSPTMSTPGENGTGQILQGYLERSNVDVTRQQLRIKFLQNWRAAILKVIDDRK